MPNFRDHGKTVDRALLGLLGRLQRGAYGCSIASDAGLRRMLGQDTGHMPGVGTLAAAIKRLGRRGLVVQVWLTRGNVLPNGDTANVGTRLCWIPRTQRQRDKAALFMGKAWRERIQRNQSVGHDARTLFAQLGAAERTSTPWAAPMTQQEWTARQRAGAEALRAWAERERAEGRDPDGKPPD